MTRAQQRALETLWQDYGLDPGAGYIDPASLFGGKGPTVLEIGFGNGQLLADVAREYPETGFLGIEVHRPGVGHLLLQIERYGLDNIRIWNHDAVEILEQCIGPDSLDAVWLFFPDPWPKKKHHKRRIINRRFLDLVADRLRNNGILHIATDWQDYAAHIQMLVGNDTRFETLVDEADTVSPVLSERPTTRFEQRGVKMGHDIHDFRLRLAAYTGEKRD